MKNTIKITLTFKVPSTNDPQEWATNIAEHLRDTFNDDGSLNSLTAKGTRVDVEPQVKA